MDFGGGIWGFVVIGGPILLALALIWAKLNNRRSNASERRTEEATRNLYEQQDREDKAASGNGNG